MNPTNEIAQIRDCCRRGLVRQKRGAITVERGAVELPEKDIGRTYAALRHQGRPVQILGVVQLPAIDSVREVLEMPSGEGLTVYCQECKVARPVARVMGDYYILKVCGHTVLREGF
jgi:hypothetical protein